MDPGEGLQLAETSTKVYSLSIQIVQLNPSYNLDAENILRAPKRFGLHQIVEGTITIPEGYFP